MNSKKINTSGYLGIALVLLAISRITDYINVGSNFTTSLAIAGTLFVISDYFLSKYEGLEIALSYRKRYFQFIENIENKEFELNEELKKGLLFQISRKQKFYHSINHKLFILSGFLGVIAIVFLPHMNFIINLTENETILISDFTVYLSLGITLYLSSIKENWANFHNELQQIYENILAMVTQNVYGTVRLQYEKEKNEILNNQLQTTENYYELLKKVNAISDKK